MAIGFFLGTRYQEGNYFESNFLPLDFEKNNKVNKVLNLIRKNYVDSVNVDSMENLAIDEILNNLDPHSVYLPPVQAKKQTENLEGSFEGIGIEYYMLADTLFVAAVKPDGPSEKAGILKGDRIIAVDGELLSGKGLLAATVVNKLKGKKGSIVEVSVLRNGHDHPKKIAIIRGNITINSIEVSYMVNSETAFIRLGKFDSKTEESFARELHRLQDQGMKNLILDLRGNGGGYLNAATGIADQFLKDKELIVYTKGLHEPRTDYKATGNGLFETGKLAILIDEGTASASEIVAGAVQDLDRGFIIGRQSFGKGLVQEQFPFDDGSAMNLTVARYYTPSGRSIQKSYNKGVNSSNKDQEQRYHKVGFSYTDSVKKDSSYKTHPYKTVKGRIVYEGSGITPDYFIPLDTSFYNDFYKKIIEKNLLHEFVYRFLVNEKNADLYKSAEDFRRNYMISDDVFKKFIVYASKNNINASADELKTSSPQIKKELKALSARYYFRDEGYYRVLNAKDSMIKKALELFNSSNVL